MTGKTISHFRIGDRIGGGGMGVVYEAEDLDLERRVALKFLPPHLGADAEANARFEREAKSASALDHPNVCTIFEVGRTEDDKQFIAMPYYQGQTLKQVIAARRVSVQEAVDIAAQIADGLAAAHELGIVHRDIKPANIFTTDRGRVVIIDFGLAKLSGAFDLTQTGSTVGTSYYMSPEQLTGGIVDHRTDLWSLGIVLFEMLANRRPFDGAYEQAIGYQILNADPALPAPDDDLDSTHVASLRAIVDACLQKNPDDRITSAKELAQRLREHARDNNPGSLPKSDARAGDVGVATAVGTATANVTGTAAATATANAIATTPSRASIAVLPFANLSADPENAYFADGIMEDVIAQLSKIRALKVISKSSAMQFKQREQGHRENSLREIAATLNVATVLEGSVRRSQNRVRIVAQLVNAESDEHLWVETYDRDLTDIFAIQTDVALRIATALRAELSPDERGRLGKRPTHDLEAYQFYLQGRQHLVRFTRDGLLNAIDLFEKAIKKDPDFAHPYAGLAFAYAEGVRGTGSLELQPAEGIQRAKEAVARALEIDGELGAAHCMRAYLQFTSDFDWVGAERSFRLALEYDPGNADVYDLFGHMLNSLDRFDEALVMLKKAQELDPLAHRTDVITCLLRAGRPGEALEVVESVLKFDPMYPRAHGAAGWAHFRSGNTDAGIAALRRAVELAPGDMMWLAQLGQALGLAGQLDEARDILAQLVDAKQQRYVSPYHMAYVFVGLGEHDRALDLLEQAYEERAGAIHGIKGSFLFEPLRSNPRFKALLVKMNLA